MLNHVPDIDPGSTQHLIFIFSVYICHCEIAKQPWQSHASYPLCRSGIPAATLPCISPAGTLQPAHPEPGRRVHLQPLPFNHGKSGTTNDFLVGLYPFRSITRALSSLTTSRFPALVSISIIPSSLLDASFFSSVCSAASFRRPFSS